MKKRKSNIVHPKTTVRQIQRKHRTPIYRSCINCGCNTNKFIWHGKVKEALYNAIVSRYGIYLDMASSRRIVFMCGDTCAKEFITNHKGELLEEITK